MKVTNKEIILRYIKTHEALLILSVLFLLLGLSCTKEKDTIPALEYGRLIDIEGNIYTTVKIGDKWWMAENLRVKKYSDGTDIVQLQDDQSWISRTPGWCLFDNNNTSPGLLYNYYAVSNPSNIAPDGWHVPTDDEWKALEQSIGMYSNELNKTSWRGIDEGNKMKVSGNSGWALHDQLWPDNASGFSALAGACRLPDAKWADPGLFYTGFWWTSSSDLNGDSFFRYLDYKEQRIYRNAIDPNYGMSIRCVKD